MKHKPTHSHGKQICLYQVWGGSTGEGWFGSLRLAGANYYGYMYRMDKQVPIV